MRRALRRGGWALSLTAGLTLTVAAAAQPPGQPFAGAAAKWPSAPPAATRPRPEDLNRDREIAVELAWLADPLTFPYHLGTRVTGQSLEIRGYVPTAAVRQRAAKIAREHCPLPLVDRLTIRPEVAANLTTVPVEQLHAVAIAALKGTFPVQSPRIVVEARPYGQVILTGPVSSQEEKLAVSASLRRLPGCTSVVNHLQAGDRGASTPFAPAQTQARTPSTAVTRPTPPPPSHPSPMSMAHTTTTPTVESQVATSSQTMQAASPYPTLPAPQKVTTAVTQTLPRPEANRTMPKDGWPSATGSPYASQSAAFATTAPRWTAPPATTASTPWASVSAPAAKSSSVARSTTTATAAPYDAPIVPPLPRKIADLPTLPPPQNLSLATKQPPQQPVQAAKMQAKPTPSTPALELAPAPPRSTVATSPRPTDNGSGIVKVQYQAPPPKPATLPQQKLAAQPSPKAATPLQQNLVPQPQSVKVSPPKSVAAPPVAAASDAQRGWQPTWKGSAENVPQKSSVVRGLPPGDVPQQKAIGGVVRAGYQTIAGTPEPVRQASLAQTVQRPTPASAPAPVQTAALSRQPPPPVQTVATPVRTFPPPVPTLPAPAPVQTVATPIRPAVPPVQLLPAPAPVQTVATSVRTPPAPAPTRTVPPPVHTVATPARTSPAPAPFAVVPSRTTPAPVQTATPAAVQPPPGEAYVTTGVMIVSEPER